MKAKSVPKKPSEPEIGCPLNACLQFISGAWTAEIIWHLQKGPRRFGDLQRALAGVSAKVLTARLKELEESEVVSRTVHPTKPPTVEYALTDLGKQFEPVLSAIVEVGKNLRKRGAVQKPKVDSRRKSLSPRARG